MPELIYEKAEDVPAALKEIAKEKDGKFIANVVAKSELDEFRNRNVEISKERDTLTSTIGRLTTDLAFDPEDVEAFVTSVKEAQDVKQQVDDGKLVKDTSLKDAVEAKTGEMKRQYEQKISGLETANRELITSNEGLKKDLNRSIVDREVMLAINHPESGALPEASRNIIREAYDAFVVEDGKLVPKDPDGNVIYGADGASPMSPREWLKKLSEEQPFFFKSAQGGGSGGGNGPAGTLTAAQIAAMSPEERMTYGRNHQMNTGSTPNT